MALQHCPECGGRVSSKAKECPHCGYRLRHIIKKVAKGAAIAGGVGLGLAILSQCGKETK